MILIMKLMIKTLQLILVLGFIIINSFFNKILILNVISSQIYYITNILFLTLLQFGFYKIYDNS